MNSSKLALNKYAMTGIIFILIAAGAWIRIAIYGDFNLSVGNLDTESYIRSSRAPVFSWDIFTGRRPFTTNLIYQLANDPQQCPLQVIANPALDSGQERQVQACFDQIVILQNVLAVLSWSCLCWTTSRWIKSTVMKLVGVVLILLFGFTPQITEWAFILSAESLTFSLFIFSFALMQEIGFKISQDSDQTKSVPFQVLLVAWALVFFFWIFIRDVDFYLALVSLLFLAFLISSRRFRQDPRLWALMLFLIAVFILGSRSAQESNRSHNSLLHSYDTYILPYPDRVEFMRQFGMPTSGSSEYSAWLDTQATKAYGLYLLSHPKFVISTLWDLSFYLESDFVQPYFKTKGIPYRDLLLRIGEILHPQTIAIYLMDLIIMIACVIKAFRLREPGIMVWAWLAGWFFLCAAFTLFTSLFGDTSGTRRHVFVSVEMFRLFFWIFLLPHLDYSSNQIS